MTATDTANPIAQLAADHADTIATTIGRTADEEDRTPDGFIRLIQDAADILAPVRDIAEPLDDAATDLRTVLDLADGDDRTRILDRARTALAQAAEEIELT